MQIIQIFIFIVSIIIMFTTKDPNIILGCGLWGIINVKKSKFDKTLFNVLGIQNDSRGGDSCGIFIDGKTEYGIDKLKLYANFYKRSKIINETTKCKIALGHCRKASVGVISEKTAQPIVIKDDNGNTEFVVMHNGTIYNYKALAQKYIPDVDITGMTDSQVMARIFYYTGYDCLSEYYGGAVFIIIDYRIEPTVYLFKGSSKTNTHSTVETEERPLYYVQTDDTFVFSSLYTFLAASTPEETVYTLIPNQLIEVKADDCYLVQDYPRNKVAQTLPSNYNSNYYKEMYGYDDYDFYDWDNKNTKQIPFQEENKEKEKKENPKVIRVTSEGIYHIDNKPVHGKYIVNSDGLVFQYSNPNTSEFWFWDGILLYGHVEFMFLSNACKYYQLAYDDVKYTCPEILNYLSPYPIKDPDYVGNNNIGDKWFKCTDMDNLEFYNGTIQLPLEAKQFYCKEGTLMHTTWTNKDKGFREYWHFVASKKIDMGSLYKLLR